MTRHIDYDAHSKLQSEVEQWIASGGKITEVPNNIHTAPDYGLFDKPKSELAQIARKERRSTFLYQCPIHAVSKHKVSDMTCRECSKRKTKGEKQ